VQLVERDGVIALKVRDDGSGFDTGETSTGFGLVGMQDRASLIGGEARVTSAPESGTTVTAKVPARYRESADGDAHRQAGKRPA
jgi:signal transduction histidine kinase